MCTRALAYFAGELWQHLKIKSLYIYIESEREMLVSYKIGCLYPTKLDTLEIYSSVKYHLKHVLCMYINFKYSQHAGAGNFLSELEIFGRNFEFFSPEVKKPEFALQP